MKTQYEKLKPLIDEVEKISKEAPQEPKMITITQEEYDQLVKDQTLLVALHNAGVDNWEHYAWSIEHSA